jgi:hypothetical protein
VQLRSAGEPCAPAVGKQTRVESLVQQRAEPGGGAASGSPAGGSDTAGTHDAASHGISGSATALPHAAQIQHLFGRHDISNIQAHVDAPAAAGARAMGAEAYATGNHVAFGAQPDLHTAAHEAAHVVQQRAGVHLKGGVGQAGDPYERNADEVADRVVQGRSAEDLLPDAGGGGASRAVQKVDGKITHQGKVGEGQVTARENDLDPSDKSNDNYSLDYTGKDANDAHWLQFLNLSMVAEVPGTGKVFATGSVAATGGNMQYSDDKTFHWSVDSGSASNPYYEAAGSNVRTPNKSTKMFDEPGGPSIAGVAAQFVATKAAKATKVTFSFRFDTYLIVKDKATYHVEWSSSTDYDPAKKTTAAIVYATGNGGSVAGLPKNLKTALDARYAGNKIQ